MYLLSSATMRVSRDEKHVLEAGRRGVDDLPAVA
jgi:hypothetical protein